MSTETGRWEEADSRAFLEFGDLLVPNREEQLATLVQLVPAAAGEEFALAELAPGGGVLARALLGAFPRMRYLGLDRSEVMLKELRETLAPFGGRVELRRAELDDPALAAALPRPLRAVLSSLAIHHLHGPGKRRLYAGLAGALEPGGALLVADLVEPASSPAREVYARQWDEAVRRRSLEKRGDLAGHDFFVAEEWNYFVHGADDPVDHPSSLADQLRWMEEAGVRTPECFWMNAGHAIFGGYV